MNARRITNTPASVHQRLLNQARASNRPFNELLQYYAMERFLYRLSKSEYADRFVLKGALLLRVWQAPSPRPTMDIDLLGRTSNAPESLEAIIRDVCDQAVEDDGLNFDATSVSAAAIVEAADYAGVRLRFRGKLGTARVAMQVDVGFGDVVTPEPSLVDFPTLLDLPGPRLLAYPREAVVAEKFQVMLYRGMLNSRLRDYYDIRLLSRSFRFDGPCLAESIKNTCTRRDTPIVAKPVGLSEEFASEVARRTQWKAFRRKSKLDDAPEELSASVAEVSMFLGPIAAALGSAGEFSDHWDPPGPWRRA